LPSLAVVAKFAITESFSSFPSAKIFEMCLDIVDLSLLNRAEIYVSNSHIFHTTSFTGRLTSSFFVVKSTNSLLFFSLTGQRLSKKPFVSRLSFFEVMLMMSSSLAEQVAKTSTSTRGIAEEVTMRLKGNRKRARPVALLA